MGKSLGKHLENSTRQAKVGTPLSLKGDHAFSVGQQQLQHLESHRKLASPTFLLYFSFDFLLLDNLDSGNISGYGLHAVSLTVNISYIHSKTIQTKKLTLVQCY